MSLFNLLPFDLQRLICFLFLSVKDIKKLELKFYNDPQDVYWKQMLTTVTDERTPEGTTHRDFYESFIYEKVLQKEKWNNRELLDRMIADEIFLSRHINLLDKNGCSALMYSAYYSKVEYIKQLLTAGADVNLQNVYGDTALFYAVVHSDGESIKYLLTAGANINHQSKMGFTALMIAAVNSKIENFKHLLAAGADVKLKNVYGDTALSLINREEIKNLPEKFFSKDF
jgi:ankyrin repeat protein